MGSCCSSEDPVDDKQDNLISKHEVAKLSLSRNMKQLIKGIGSVINTALPESSRLFPGSSMEQMATELVDIMCAVVAARDTTLMPEQHLEVLRRSTQQGIVGGEVFVEMLHRKHSDLLLGRKKKDNDTGAKHSSSSRSEIPRLLQLWFDADVDCSGALEESEVQGLLSSVNIQMSKANLKKLMNEVDTSQNGQLEFTEFIHLYEVITTIKDCQLIFDRFRVNVPGAPSKNSPPLSTGTTTRVSENLLLMTEGNLSAFLVSHQQEVVEGSLMAFLSLFGPLTSIPGTLEMGITQRQFQLLLTDPQSNSWMDPVEASIHHDMTQPLTHYFIDSSHNTYLTGHQLRGESSTEMYRNALLLGCRSVEIDCWDGPNNDPLVTHGHTLTSKLRFENVIKVINENAFVNSPFPVTLSLEIHTSVEQQDVQVAIMKKYFGSKLTTAAMADASSLSGFEFSPEGLKFKIIVKAKRRKNEIDAEEEAEVSTAPPGTAQTTTAGKDDDPDHVVSLSLSNATYMASTRYTAMEKALTLKHYYIASVDETKVEKWEKNPTPFAELTKQFFLRVYPKGIRIDSTNYSPQHGWNIGAQMNAMNVQTHDAGMRLNRYKFVQNARCGYILKPRCMRTPGVKTEFKDRLLLTVRVLCGVQLPKPGNSKTGEVIDPFVELWVHGFGDDDTSHRVVSTRVVDDNGFNPRWDESFTFSINALEMATLFLCVMEKDPVSAEFVGDAACPLASLRSGFRCVPLHLENFVQLPSPTCLLCHFSWSDGLPQRCVTTAPPRLGKAQEGQVGKYSPRRTFNLDRVLPPVIPLGGDDRAVDPKTGLDQFTVDHLELL